jgi:hypothetical protein
LSSSSSRSPHQAVGNSLGDTPDNAIPECI